MKHPNEVQLALFAGGDLGRWDRWVVGRHVSRCSACESEVSGLRAAREQVRVAAPDLPKDLNWNRLAQEMTGNIRVGLEDSLYIGPGKLAKSNAEQVAKIRRIVEELGFEVATPAEARATLGLKGADRVKF